MKRLSLSLGILTAAFIIGCGESGGSSPGASSSSGSSVSATSSSDGGTTSVSSSSEAVSSWPALDATVDDLASLTLDGAVAYFGNIEENTGFVTTITANRPATFAIPASGSLPGDETHFEIVPVGEQAAELHFITAPDFERPTDSDTDNVYSVSVTVEATDGATMTFAIAVNVTDRALPKTGQTQGHTEFYSNGSGMAILYKDDGYYQKGLERNFEQNATNPLLVIDHAQHKQWTNFYAQRDFADADTFCVNANYQGLTGWRLPNPDELFYMTDKSVYGPTLDSLFDTLSAAPYWTADSWMSDTGYAWTVDFAEGNLTHDASVGENLYITCVHGEPLTHEWERDDVAEVVADLQSDLMWQDNTDAAASGLNWFESVYYCEELSLGGYDDWRLPNINELVSLASHSHTAPAAPEIIQKISSVPYWSSTSDVRSQYDRAWRVDFSDGATPRADKHDNDAYVRCVRDY